MQVWKPVIRHCRNCGAKIIGFKNKQGVVKVDCPKCGVSSISKMLDRRHERCDTYAPPGMESLDEDEDEADN